MESESGVTQSIIDELHSLDIQGDKMVAETGVTRSIIDEIHSSFIQRDQMEGGSSFTRSIIDELHSFDIQGDQMESGSGVTRSIIDELIPGISKEIKWKVKVVLLQKSLMNFILRIWSNERWKWCYSTYH